MLEFLIQWRRNICISLKNDTQWSANREILVATVSTKDTFAIYRSDGQQQETWNCNDLMKRWEDKTKKKESIDINLAMNKTYNQHL